LDSKLIHVESFGKTFYQNKARANDLAKVDWAHTWPGQVLPKVEFKPSLITFNDFWQCTSIWQPYQPSKVFTKKNRFKSKCDSSTNNKTFQFLECESECEYPWKRAHFKEIPNSNAGIAGLTRGMFGELVACNPGIILTTLIGVVPSADNMVTS
jgi:hypothetical protein